MANCEKSGSKKSRRDRECGKHEKPPTKVSNSHLRQFQITNDLLLIQVVTCHQPRQKGVPQTN